MRFEFEVHGDKLVSREMLRISDRVINFSPVWPTVADDIRESEQALFDSQGASSGRPWAPLRVSTLAKKIRNHLDLRILHARGPLERSLTQGSGAAAAEDQVVIITPSSLAFGTSVPYAGRLHRGWTIDGSSGEFGRVPGRRSLDFSEHDKQRMINRLQRYAIRGEIRRGPEIR